jgi:hypothetical protein
MKTKDKIDIQPSVSVDVHTRDGVEYITRKFYNADGTVCTVIAPKPPATKIVQHKIQDSTSHAGSKALKAIRRPIKGRTWKGVALTQNK